MTWARRAQTQVHEREITCTLKSELRLLILGTSLLLPFDIFSCICVYRQDSFCIDTSIKREFGRFDNQGSPRKSNYHDQKKARSSAWKPYSTACPIQLHRAKTSDSLENACTNSKGQLETSAAEIVNLF